MGWAFAGAGEFAALARSCLMEGAAQGERLMYVAEHPDPSAVAALSGVASEADLRVVTLAEVYGASGVVDPQAQLERYSREVDAALAAGYSGLRAVCDSTPMVVSEDAVAAWLQWEVLADQFMAANPMTALCAFDVQRVDRARLARLAAVHPLSSASGPVPPFRLYFEAGALRLDGAVNADSLASLRLTVAALPAGTPAEVDLGSQTAVSWDLVALLNDVAGYGTPVTVFAEEAALRTILASFPPPSPSLVLRQR